MRSRRVLVMIGIALLVFVVLAVFARVYLLV
jgi:hypothetical protein